MAEQKTNAAVAIVFFNRPEPLAKVFQRVKEAKPQKLFLIQDGPRAGTDDENKITECRQVVSDIDWQCEVYQNYSDKNLTCDHRQFTGISWAFEHTDRLIIFEDDVEISPDFIPFCDELLEKYKDDTRISMISGSMRLGQYDTKYSYNFSQIGTGWGWALWRRSWDEVREFMEFKYLEDRESYQQIQRILYTVAPKLYRNYLKRAEEVYQKDGVSGRYTSWEFAVASANLFGGKLIITPCKNLVSNRGVIEGATHSPNCIKKMPKYLWKFFNAPVYQLEFPLRHPPYVIRDMEYEKRYCQLYYTNSILRMSRWIESIIRRWIYGTKEERTALLDKCKQKLFRRGGA